MQNRHKFHVIAKQRKNIKKNFPHTDYRGKHTPQKGITLHDNNFM